MNYKINVTQKHIDNGCRHKCGSCPIALAIKDVVPYFYDIRVGTMAVSLDSSWEEFFELPAYAKEFVHSFDSGDKVIPFSFEIDLPI